jgi:hypothetical protein
MRARAAKDRYFVAFILLFVFFILMIGGCDGIAAYWTFFTL